MGSTDGRPQPTRARRQGLCRLVVVLAALATTVLPPTAAQARTPSAARLGRLADAVVRAGVPGVAVTVREGGRTVSVARGRSQIGRRARLAPDARFRVASVTKVMTSVVLLRLAQDEKLSLDDRVERWVPGVLPADSTVTVRELLNHTSGLAEYYDPDVILKPYLDGDAGNVWDPRDLVRLGVQAGAGPTGTFAYSDTNYVLAGLVAEAAGRRPFAALLRRVITGPLGLRATSYDLTDRRPAGLAHGYADGAGGRRIDTSALSPSIAQGAGGVTSSAPDLVTFLKGLLGGRLLDAASMAQMRRGVAMGPGFPRADRYGLGIWSTATFGLLPAATPCGRLVGHNGEFPGYTADLFGTPDNRRAFALLASSDALSPVQQVRLAALARAAAC